MLKGDWTDFLFILENDIKDVLFIQHENFDLILDRNHKSWVIALWNIKHRERTKSSKNWYTLEK